MDIDAIHKIGNFYRDQLYSATRREQETDELYINDTFEVPEIKAPHVVLRSGLGRRIVDAAGEQIVTGNPQSLFEVLKGDKDSKERLTAESNRWISFLKKMNPNPFKESVKNKLGRGESVLQLVHNKRWVTGDKVRFGLPVLFMVRDSMNVYCSPEEDDSGWFPNCGVPNKVVIIYERQPLDVILRYPSWSNPKGKGTEKDPKGNVTWFEYWDKNTHFAEADGEVVFNKKNIYGFVPFVRKFSGFGRRSPDGDLSNLIVSDIRYSRDLIREECAIRSDIASLMHLYANTCKTLIVPSGSDLNVDELKENYIQGPGEFNVLQLPEGSGFTDDDIKLPSKEAFDHYYAVKQELERRHPLIMAGYPLGYSGRQQDLSSMAAMQRYDTVVENTEVEWATAFMMAFQMTKIVPTLKPDGVQKKDLDAMVDAEVKLKASDPLEKSARVTLGDKLWNQGNGSIDLETNHLEFQGRTLEESKKIKAKMIADRLMLYNPNVDMIYSTIFAEEAELEEYLAKLQQMGQMMGQAGIPQTPTDRLRIQGEAQTPRGMAQEEYNLEKRPVREVL